MAYGREIAAAEMDEVTGALRRRVGLAALEREMDPTERSRELLTVAFIDVDGPKRVNDQKGHAAGDPPQADTAAKDPAGDLDLQVSIVLAHHQAVVRSALRMLLDSVEGLEVVAAADNMDSVRRYVLGHHPGVLVLDVDLEQPDCSAVPTILLVRRESPETGIVVMNLNQDAAVVREAMAAGAVGFLPASATADELFEAVTRAGANQTYVSPAILAVSSNEDRSGPGGLTSREVQVLGLIAVGFTNVEIGEQLYLSVRTIESHRARIQTKLGHLSRAELVAYAVAHRITSR